MTGKTPDNSKGNHFIEGDPQPTSGAGGTGRHPVEPGPERQEQLSILRPTAVTEVGVSAANRSAGENLLVKEEMAKAMIKMGIAEKDVMDILNIIIK